MKDFAKYEQILDYAPPTRTRRLIKRPMAIPSKYFKVPLFLRPQIG